MNKTIIININGTIFHIEEDAYEVLKNYMTDVKRHFASAEDSLEITTDIENRIAEMFTEILSREARQVIVTADVSGVIEQMGTVEDFESTTAEGSTDTGSFADQPHFNYSRKLFRDPDDHLIAGVCAGIANYFDIETVWVRIAFALAFCFGGTGLMLYIILWIVVPQASSRADRMAMKGEPLDLQGFKRNFEEEAKNLQNAFNKASDKARPFAYKARDFVGDLFHHLGRALRGAGRLFVKLLGILIILVCFGFFIAALVGLIALLAYGRDIYHIFPFSMFSSLSSGLGSLICFSAFALAALPLLAIIMLTLRVVFNSPGLNRSAGYTMLIVWIGSLSILIYYGARISKEFKDYASFSQTINIKPSKNKIYHLQLNDVMYLTRQDSMRMNIDRSFNGKIILDDNDDNRRERMPRTVEINIEKADVDHPILEEKFSANGPDDIKALANARNVTYNFTQKDSVLLFDRLLQLPKNKPWRNQKVTLTLKVPNGTELIVDENINYLINNILEIGDCKRKNNAPYWTSGPFMMTDSGMYCKIDTLPLQQQPKQQPLAK